MGQIRHTIRLEGGKLYPNCLFQILPALWLTRATGVLVLRRGQVVKGIALRQGAIVGSQSNQTSDRLDRLLLAAGQIRLSVYQELQQRVRAKPELRPGELLVAMGAIDRTALEKALERQLLWRIGSLFTWSEGEYLFSPGEVRVHCPVVGYADVFAAGVRWRLGDRFLLELGTRLLDGVPQPVRRTLAEQYLACDGELLRFADRVTGRIAFRGIFDPFEPLRFWQLMFALRELGAVAFDLPQFSATQSTQTSTQSAMLGDQTQIDFAVSASSKQPAEELFQKGRRFLLKRMLADAERCFLKASAMSPARGRYLGFLAWTRLLRAPRNGQVLEACLRLLYEACALAPASADVAFFKAGTLWLLRRGNKALAAFRQVLRINPHHPEASLILARLQPLSEQQPSALTPAIEVTHR